MKKMIFTLIFSVVYFPSRAELEWRGDKTGHICRTAARQRRQMKRALAGDVGHMSIMNDGTPIEPLTGIGRHPFARVGCTLKHETSIFDISYLNISSFCQTKPPQKAYFMDMGCAAYNKKAAVASASGSSIPLFEKMYDMKACVQFDMVFAWEAKVHPKWWHKVPEEKNALSLMMRLREKGIRAHFWI